MVILHTAGTFHDAMCTSKTAHQEETIVRKWGHFKKLTQGHYCYLMRGHVTALVQPACCIPSRGYTKIMN